MSEHEDASQLEWIRESIVDLIGAIEMLARVINPERAEGEIVRMYQERAGRDLARHKTSRKSD